MKESKLYFNFFKKHLIWFLVVSAISASLGFFVQVQKPPEYQLIRLFEINSSTADSQANALLVQEAVTLVRSENIQQELGVTSQITVYNNSPLTLTLQVVSNNQKLSTDDLNTISHYIQGKFGFMVSGKDLYRSSYPNVWLGVLGGFLVGNGLLILALLVGYYFRKY